jgi:adenosylcobyric acid synthase
VIAHAARRLVMGICGGMQMLGETITDPEGIEREGSAPGLGLLPIHTTMRAEKVTRSATGTLHGNTLFGQRVATRYVAGYEIHVGETSYAAHARPFATFTETEEWDGCVSENVRVVGTYLHGVFDEDGFRHAFLLAARAFAGLGSDVALTGWKTKREESLNRLADEVSKALDLRTIFGWVGQEDAVSRRQKDEAECAR